MQDGRRDDTNQEEVEQNEDVIPGEAKPSTGQHLEEQSQDDIGQELEQLKGLAAQLDNNYRRALADYQNLQRRTQEEKAEWIRMAGRDLILKLLPVLDTLVMAAKHLQDKGLDLGNSQFLNILRDEGVTRIEALGKEFDPTTMEVVTTQEVDEKDKGKVVEEARAGFMYHDSVLRAAQVIVGK